MLKAAMPTLLTKSKSGANQIASISMHGKKLDELLNKEWLLANTRGGYSSSTVIGCNARRYHGLLIGTLNPPADRIMALSNILESIISQGKVLNLSTFEFIDKCNPSGFNEITTFRRDLGVHFNYQIDGFELTRSIYLARNKDLVLVRYKFIKIPGPCELVLRPFVGLRDFHSLQKSHARLCLAEVDDCLHIRHDVPQSCELLLNSPGMVFEKDIQWWFSFLYRQDRDRGQDFLEDLWTPGFYKYSVNEPCEVIFKACLSSADDAKMLSEITLQELLDELSDAEQDILSKIKTKDKTLKKLAAGADQFICRRKSKQGQRATILAGYPWFFDWGRDAFISLPGLLLQTGRFEDAKSVLTTFAAASDEGMIPNRFDDYSDTAHFNSVDASLWFIDAAFQYLKITNDSDTFNNHLLETICRIIDSYQKGTRFEIHADSDGLITAGNEQTQLTWMDAKFDGVVFTPRYGKAVEVNALWYNALCSLGKFYERLDENKSRHFKLMSEEVKENYRRLFWNEQLGYLNDCVYPDSKPDTSCRPNQIFAVSLDFSPLSAEQQQKVVAVVQQKLLTPYGLRSLSPDDPRYIGKCIGSQKERDRSYHQGTVWAYLIGHFVQAYLKVNDFSMPSRLTAQQFLEPLVKHFNDDACIGSVSEIFDGDLPHEPRGCFAQAWSVAELIRALMLIKG
ncbi:MAG: amylo-alpha-1,6-glucosidase [Phycisphaerae bacterium]